MTNDTKLWVKGHLQLQRMAAWLWIMIQTAIISCTCIPIKRTLVFFVFDKIASCYGMHYGSTSNMYLPWEWAKWINIENVCCFLNCRRGVILAIRSNFSWNEFSWFVPSEQKLLYSFFTLLDFSAAKLAMQTNVPYICFFHYICITLKVNWHNNPNSSLNGLRFSYISFDI